jgi:Flp pilus assembly protein CpaB
MRRFSSVIAAFMLVVILVVIEIVIIKSASKYEPMLGVVFAKVRIPEKTVITQEMIEIRNVGISYVHRQSIRNTGDVASKRAGMDIEAGEMILQSKLGSDEMEEISVRDKNKRLFSVEFKGDQANGWWLLSDQNVDIIFIPDKTFDIQTDMSTTDNKDMSSRTATGSNMAGGVQVLKDIRIAALIDDKGKLLENSDRNTLPKYISFEVTNEQASFLAIAKGNGRLEISVIPGQ